MIRGDRLEAAAAPVGRGKGEGAPAGWPHRPALLFKLEVAARALHRERGAEPGRGLVSQFLYVGAVGRGFADVNLRAQIRHDANRLEAPAHPSLIFDVTLTHRAFRGSP